MEIRDLYDSNRVLTGETICKGEQIPPNRYIAVALVFIENSKGEFLIQKRSAEKKNKYGSTGGHFSTGETSIQTMRREIKEEIGLDVNENELTLIFSGIDDPKPVFFDVYYLKKDFDISDLALQTEEVESVEWCSIDKIKQLIADDLFLKSHGEDFYILLDKLKK